MLRNALSGPCAAPLFVCSPCCECIWEGTRSFGAVWGFLQLHIPSTEGLRLQPWPGSRDTAHPQDAAWGEARPTVTAGRAPELSGPLCALCSFLLGINIRDDICSSQWGLCIWCQQTLVQASASPFTSDRGFQPSRINWINSENST